MNKEDLIPTGNYEAVAIDRPDQEGVCAYARLTETKAGDPQATAFFQILKVPEGCEPPRYPLRWNGSFKKTMVGKEPNQKTLGRITCESLRAMGWKSNDITKIEVEQLDQIVSVAVEHEEWEGKWYARVGWVNEAGGGAVKVVAMNESAKRKFAALMTEHVAKLPLVAGKRVEAQSGSQAGGSPQAATGAPQEEPPPPVEDFDDIPF